MSWGEDDQIIVGGLGGLRRVPAGGGEPEVLTISDADRGETVPGSPSIIAGANAVLFGIFTGRSVAAGSSQLAVLALGTGEVSRLGLAGISPRYVVTGHLVYVALDGSLRAVPFDPDQLTVTGNPVTLVDGVLVKNLGAANVSISDAGRLVYMTSASGVGVRSSLVWVDREGQMTTPVIDGEYINGWPRLSPDGTRVAFRRESETGGEDLWIRDLERGSETKLTETGGVNRYPTWTPDGTNVAFSSDRGDGYQLYARPVDLSHETELIRSIEGSSFPGSWTPDGQTLVYYAYSGSDVGDIWSLPVGGDPVPFLDTGFNETAPRLFPNGKWLAYISNQPGEDQVFVQAFPGGGPVFPISTGPSTEAVWSSDGRELFYRNRNQMWVVDVETEPGFKTGSPRVLFEAPYDSGLIGGNANYDVSLDGQRFLMVQRGAAAEAPGYVVIQNWFAELEARVPVN